MDTNNSDNPSQNGPERIVLSAETEQVTFNREPPPPYSPEQTVPQPIVHQSVIDNQLALKNIPMFYHCDKCGERVLTRVEYLNSRRTHLYAGFICGFTFWCLLCCLGAIPYIVKTCKKAHHYCPNCNTFLGAYSKV